MTSNISHSIKKRDSSNDKFYTPISLVKIHLDKFKQIPDDSIIFEPFYGNGAYFNEMKNRYSNCKLIYNEIDIGLDFFEFEGKVDYIISNPPYSIIDRVLVKSVSLKPKIISYLIGFGNITSKRIEFMNHNGYFITDFHLTKVYSWYGMSLLITFSNETNKNIVEIDRVVHK
jgi:hypothetical protein